MPARARPPRPTTVLMVRHGRTPTTGKVLPGRAKGLHLDETGQSQARAVAEHLGQLQGVTAIYTSPLERARETAAPTAAALGIRPVVDRGLVEIDTGEWTGADLTQARRSRVWKVVQQYPTGFAFPGGESMVQMQARVVTALAGIVARHPSETVIAFSHADVIRVAVAHAMGVHLDLFQRIMVGTCSVSTVSYHQTGAAVLGVNWTPAPFGERA